MSNKRGYSSGCLREQLDEGCGKLKQKVEVIGQNNESGQIKATKVNKRLGETYVNL